MKRIYVVLWLNEDLSIGAEPEKAFRDLTFAKQYVGSFYERVVDWQQNKGSMEPTVEAGDDYPRPLIIEMELV